MWVCPLFSLQNDNDHHHNLVVGYDQNLPPWAVVGVDLYLQRYQVLLNDSHLDLDKVLHGMHQALGYQAIKLMAQALKGDKSFIPANKQIIIPTLIVNKANVAEFTQKINELRGRNKN